MTQIKDLPSQQVSVDSSRRVTLKAKKGDLYEMYKQFVLPDGTIIMRPLVVTDPENVVKPETVERIMTSVSHAKKGKVGASFKKDDFADLIDNEE
jgi:hypothetical protein